MTNQASAKSSRDPDVEKLRNDPGYRQILILEFNDMIPFVLSNIRKPGIVPWFYMGINVAVLAYIVFHVLFGMSGMNLTWTTIIWKSLGGIFAGSILVIAPHELLHGLAYRILGAKNIRFGADMQQFIFFVTANRFPVSGTELQFLALTPFVIINAITVAVTVYWFPGHTVFSAFLLLSHNIMCIGDFAMVNYVVNLKGKIYTYDEIKEKKSYFFEKVVH